MTIQDFVKSGRPLQVMFYDGDALVPGIMVGNNIICACCGSLFEVDEVLENAREDGVEAIRLFDHWVDLCKEIVGSEEDDWRQYTIGFEEDM